ncbi:S-adenosyl-L-methionine-dependent methyltransferase [Corynespora cassiicola Philippines]|uniref:S-adenosyl-L-methionine-dependent methyltransferase n=1 Tax=Corynespora cassiicola Philippines TaxID=1448308 RepID=A0A2T2NFM1_CORCC|nr:S-adenosyl-L-methionine-dependent methyltransferase [Corynespora cassiicola Philippines]
MATQVETTTLYLAQARACSNVQDCLSIYDKWAATYNDEVGDEAQNYVAPVLVAKAALQYSSNPTRSAILDAGCGTGLVGEALAVAGSRVIDGLDLSPAMLKVAKKTGVYRHVTAADLNERIQKPDQTYDIVTCVGTFTLGHVGPAPALQEFVRVLKKDGIVVATILQEIWEAQGFDIEVARLQKEGLVSIVAQELIDYVKGHGDKAIMIVLV